jgi:hypothetical protein
LTVVADLRWRKTGPAGRGKKSSPPRFTVDDGSGVGVRERSELPSQGGWGDGAGEGGERKCVCGVKGRWNEVVVTQQAWP